MVPHRDAGEVVQFPFKQRLIVSRRTGNSLMRRGTVEHAKGGLRGFGVRQFGKSDHRHLKLFSGRRPYGQRKPTSTSVLFMTKLA